MSKGSATLHFRTTLRPGDLGCLTYLHGDIYAQEYGWDPTFEAYVAAGLAEFVLGHDRARERVWIAEIGGETVGSIAIVRGAGRGCCRRYGAAALVSGEADGARSGLGPAPRGRSSGFLPGSRLPASDTLDGQRAGSRGPSLPGGRVHPRLRVDPRALGAGGHGREVRTGSGRCPGAFMIDEQGAASSATMHELRSGYV